MIYNCGYCNGKVEVNLASSDIVCDCPLCGHQMAILDRLTPGDVLDGFQLRRKIDSTAENIIFVAYQQSMDRDVMLFVLRPEIAADDAMRERYLERIKAISKVRHAHIAGIYGAGLFMGLHYVAMTYMDGISLAQCFKKRQFLSEKDGLVLLESLADALSTLKDECGTMHCELSPKCIMFDHSGHPELTSLGLLGTISDNEPGHPVQQHCDLVHYMSPEQINGEVLDYRSDMYSLGAIFYHAITGHKPYARCSVEQIRDRMDHDGLEHPCDYNDSLSVATVELLGVLLAKDRAERFEDWSSLKAAARQAMTTATAAKPEIEAPKPAAVTPDLRKELKTAASRKKKRTHTLPFIMLVICAVIGLSSFTIYTKYQANKKAELLRLQAEEQLKRTEQIQSKLNEARIIAKEQPWMDAETIALFQAAITIEPKNLYAQKAARELEAYRGEFPSLKQEAYGKVRVAVASLSPDEAIAFLQTYNGPFSLHLQSELEAMTNEIQQKESTLKRANENRRNQALNAVTTLQAELAEQLLLLHFSTVESLIQRAQSDPVYKAAEEELNSLCSQVKDVAVMPQVIADSFKGSIGKNVNVNFENEAVALEVVGVGKHVVKARLRKDIRGMTAYSARNFSPGQLSVKEQFNRIKSQQGTSGRLMKGLLFARAGHYDKAADAFEGVETPFGNSLATALEKHAGNLANSFSGRTVEAPVRNRQNEKVALPQGSGSVDDFWDNF